MTDQDIARHATRFCRVALANIGREYPNKLDHVLDAPDDAHTPRRLHPVFYGSFDWHSCVHMHWTLARLLRRVPDLPEAPRIHSLFDDQFMPDKIAAEADYLTQPSQRAFERTYGWAWLLKLQSELIALSRLDARAVAWRDALQPLADAFADRYLDFLPRAQFPIRAGTHANSAFGLLFALDYAECVAHVALRKLIVRKGHDWFGRDRRYPAAYEPGGEDFLSGGLMEAALMLRLVDGCGYADWWEIFCPPDAALTSWLTPVAVTDRTDPKLAHLDGLNLSRAWCWKLLMKALPARLRAPARQAIDAHLAASLPHAAAGDYALTHWLASFAMLALTEPL